MVGLFLDGQIMTVKMPDRRGLRAKGLKMNGYLPIVHNQFGFVAAMAERRGHPPGTVWGDHQKGKSDRAMDGTGKIPEQDRALFLLGEDIINGQLRAAFINGGPFIQDLSGAVVLDQLKIFGDRGNGP